MSTDLPLPFPTPWTAEEFADALPRRSSQRIGMDAVLYLRPDAAPLRPHRMQSDRAQTLFARHCAFGAVPHSLIAPPLRHRVRCYA